MASVGGSLTLGKLILKFKHRIGLRTVANFNQGLIRSVASRCVRSSNLHTRIGTPLQRNKPYGIKNNTMRYFASSASSQSESKPTSGLPSRQRREVSLQQKDSNAVEYFLSAPLHSLKTVHTFKIMIIYL
jgi:hypothetical protein